jgi:ATP/maltotriose-dependent transcriptional regulator MalT
MGEKAYFATTVALLARCLVFQERWDEAEAATIESEEAAGDAIHVTGEWGPTRARVLAHRGEAEEAEAIARKAVDILVEQDVFFRGYALTSLAEVLVSAGKLDEARECARAALAKYERKGLVPLAEKVGRWTTALVS